MRQSAPPVTVMMDDPRPARASCGKRVDSFLGRHLPAELVRVIHNFSWLYLEQAGRAAMSLVVGALTARYLGPDQIGSFNFIATIVGFAGIFVALDLDSLSVRELVQRPQVASQILGTVFWIRLSTASLAFLGTLGAVALLQSGDRLAIALALLMAPSLFLQAFMNIDIWFQSQYRSKLTVASRLTGAVVANAIRLLLIYFHAPLTAFAAVYLAEFAFTTVALIYVYGRSGGTLKDWRLDWTFATNLLRPVTLLLLTTVGVQLQNRLDIVLLQQFKGVHVVGLYTSALNLLELASAPVMLLAASIAPLLARATGDGPETLLRALGWTYKLLGTYCWIVGIGLAVFSGPIVRLLYGSQFVESSTLLALLAPRLALIGFGTIRSLFILNMRIYWFSLFSAIAGLVVNLPLAFLLIPHFGGPGAILASSLSFTCTVFGAGIFWRQTRANLRLMLCGLFLPWTFRLAEIRQLGGTLTL
jgi:O-antigen/teichoic acid export membrane protein